MTIQEFLKTLKTSKRINTSTLNNVSKSSHTHTFTNTLINNSCWLTKTSNNTLQSFLSNLTSHQLHLFLTDPSVRTYDCFRIFNLVIHSPNSLSFKPGFYAHFTLISRLIKSRNFVDVEFLLMKLFVDTNYRYPFTDFVDHIEKYCKESNIIIKMLNMLIKTYSDHGLFDMANTTFNYMVEKEVDRDEKTCSVHLHALIKAGKTDSACEFLCRMVDSGMKVSVFSLTIVVSGLCKVGVLKMGRELVEEMSRKGVKPNVVTFNTLVDACVRRWDFTELELVLHLMEEEGIHFDDGTYKRLIEGYTTSGKVEEAEKLLLEMDDKDFEVEGYLYVMVIRSYCRLGKASNGLLLLRKMEEAQIFPSVEIYSSLICGLCRAGEMGTVKKLSIEMHNNGYVLDDDIFNAIVDGYRKAGMMDELAEVQCLLKMKCSPGHQSSH